MRLREFLGHPVLQWTGCVTVFVSALILVSLRASHLFSLPQPAVLGPSAALLLGVVIAGSRRHLTWLPGAAAAASLLPLPLSAALFVAAVVARIGPRTGHRLVLARSVFGYPLTARDPDRLLHVHVLGPTGSGKSTTALEPWIGQDLQRGVGVTVMEPKGDLADAARRRALAAGRVVVPFDPTDPACPHLNLLAGASAAAGEALAVALDQMEPGAHPFYRTLGRVVVVHAVQLAKAALADRADLDAVERIVHDAPYRNRLRREVQDPGIDRFFEHEFGALPPGRQLDLEIGLLNRLQSLRMHPGAAAALSPPFDFDFDDVLASDLVLLATLSPAELGLGARGLGVLMWHLFVQAAYRAGPHGGLRHVLYLDEFHQWVSPDLADVLAMIRGYGVSIVLAHQDLGQLSPELQEAVLANARTRLVLGGTAAGDLRRLEGEALPSSFPEARYLPRGRAVLIPTVRGRQRPPRLVRLFPPRTSGL